MNLFDLFATLKFDNSDFKRGVQESKREAQGLSTSVSGSLKQAGTTIAQFGTNITNIGKTLSVVTVGVGALLGSAFSKAKDYIGNKAKVAFPRILNGEPVYITKPDPKTGEPKTERARYIGEAMCFDYQLACELYEFSLASTNIIEESADADEE